MEQSEVTVQDPTAFFSLALLQGGHFPAEQQHGCCMEMQSGYQTKARGKG